MDPALWGHMRWGYFRWGVYDPVFDRLVAHLAKVQPPSSVGVAPPSPPTGDPVGVWDYTDWDSCVWE